MRPVPIVKGMRLEVVNASVAAVMDGETVMVSRIE